MAEVTNASYTGPDGEPVVVQNGGELIVYGNVTGSVGGASVSSGGKITIHGALTVPEGQTYIYAGPTYKTAADYTTPTTKTGYLTYTDGTSTVWVKDPATGGGGGDDSGDYFVLWGKTTT
ncbi:MAG: FapA family protein, partial [Oscillospiraceae bacterium]|nr:FapA family protein [Oscillospiraceae bacterium]